VVITLLCGFSPRTIGTVCGKRYKKLVLDVFPLKNKRMVTLNNSMPVRSHPPTEAYQPRLSARISHTNPNQDNQTQTNDLPTRRRRKNHPSHRQSAPRAIVQNQVPSPNNQSFTNLEEQPSQIQDTPLRNNLSNQTHPTETNPNPMVEANPIQPPWNIPDSDKAQMAPSVLEAYRHVANHHPDVEATKALFNATI